VPGAQLEIFGSHVEGLGHGVLGGGKGETRVPD